MTIVDFRARTSTAGSSFPARREQRRFDIGITRDFYVRAHSGESESAGQGEWRAVEHRDEADEAFSGTVSR